MWKKLLLGLSLVFLLSSSVVYADVVLTDEQAEELDQTLIELETVLKGQQQTLDEQQTTIDEQGNLIEQQQTKINELNDLLDGHEKSSVLQSILTAIISCGVGILIGLLL